MSRSSPLLTLPALAILLGGGAQLARAGTPRPHPAQAAPTRPAVLSPALQKQLARLPLSFTEAGTPQRPDERYVLRGKDKSFFFSRDGVTVSLPTPATRNAVRPVAYGSTPAASRWNARLEFLGSNPQTKLQGEASTGTRVSYFTGPRATWRSGLQSFSRLRYRQLWQGVDLAYTTTADQVKHEFVVAPGADPAQIRLAYRGVDRLRVTEGGALEVTTPAGSFEDARPVAYQEQDGKRVPVAVRFEVDEAAGDAHGYHFDLGQYNRRLPLIIDPYTLVYAGFLGGTGTDTVNHVAVNLGGAAFLVGTTNSADLAFPVKVGPDTTAPGGTNAFVAKVRSDGSSLEYCGYVGGDQDEGGLSVAVDDEGNAYIGGWTESSEATFPVVGGPYLQDPSIRRNGFFAKVSVDGTHLVYCSYLGGNGYNEITGVAVDTQRRLYVTGTDFSQGYQFPTVKGPVLTSPSGVGAFAARVAADGSALEYCGYVRHPNAFSDYIYANAVAVDDLGAAYVVGYVAVNYEDGGNYNDGFVAKVAADGTAISYWRPMPGSGDDRLNAVAVRNRRAYVTGITNSGERTIPVKGGPKLLPQGSTDALVACVAPSGASYDFCGFLGSLGGDSGNGIAVDASGNVYVTGYTYTYDTQQFPKNPFPLKVGPDLTMNGGMEAFITKIPAGAPSQVVYSGFLGGSGDDNGLAVAVDVAGAAYVVGSTTSNAQTSPSNLPGDFPVKGGLPRTNGGGIDGFVLKVLPNPDVRIYPDLAGEWGEVIGTGSGAGTDYRITLDGEFIVRNIGTAPAGRSTLRLLLSTNNTVSADDLLVAYTAVPVLPSGGTQPVPFHAVLPRGVNDIRLRYLIGVVDYTNTVDEPTDANNVITLGPLLPRPDLTGQWGTVNQSSTGTGADTQITLEGDFQLQNLGIASATSYTLRLLLSTDSVASADDIALAYVSRSTIPAGGVQNVHFLKALPKGLTSIQGRYLIGVVDFDKTVSERDETNNTAVNGPLP